MKSKYKPVGKLQSQNNQTWFHYDPAVNASLIHHILTKDISTDVLSSEGRKLRRGSAGERPGRRAGGFFGSAAWTPPNNRGFLGGFVPLPAPPATSSAHLWTFFPLLLPTALLLLTEAFVPCGKTCGCSQLLGFWWGFFFLLRCLIK